MKRNLLLVSAVVIAALTSCTTDSELDQAIVSATSSDASTQTPIEFTTYASSAATTKGTAVTSNTDFKSVGSFDVAALVSDGEFTLSYEGSSNNHYSSYSVVPAAAEAEMYFNPSSVLYNSTDSKWENQNSMYWPNLSMIMHFAAYSPSGILGENVIPTFEQEYTKVETDDVTTYDCDYSYSFDYTVTDAISSQADLMYAITTVDYISPSDQVSTGGVSYITNGADAPNYEESVNLHFKHALTQIAFTATKDSDIEVYVKSLTICNVYNSGTFTAIANTDDSDDSDAGDDTVGNSSDEDDRVNADNFGTWDATYTGTWKDDDKDGYADVDGGGFSAMSNYAAAMVSLDDKSPASEDSIKINADTDNSENSVTQLTSTSDVLMLIPQKLTAWVPTSSTVLNYIGSYATGGSYEDPDDETSTYYSYADGGLSDGEYANPSINSANRTLSYLAIDCEIYHNDSEVAIHDGYIFVPFETSNIKYASASVDAPDDYTYTTDEWLAGYKITYCLNFGGGYVVEEGDHDTIPEPGCIPDTETYTLRTITYTTTCDAWVDVSGGSMDLGEFDTSVSSASN